MDTNTDTDTVGDKFVHLFSQTTFKCHPLTRSLFLWLVWYAKHDIAVYGFSPLAVRKNAHNFIVYFSCSFGISYDTKTLEPKRASLKYLWKQFVKLVSGFVSVSLLISVLKQCDYEYFETGYPANSMDQSLRDLFSWRHMLNNFLLACK